MACGDLVFSYEAERPLGTSTTHVTLDNAARTLSLDFNGWSYTSLHEITTIALSVQHASYTDVSDVKITHTFTVTEVDCSSRFDNVPN